ncbi:hypothetical protein RJ639_023455 [Escallonia herrerae]|uniref:FAR1 domain-containing protein n=1 Tax=Escallonia herrerae TaxID=1293975 RepID=A0AA88V017_9ASTE|nr:hypothetical protein RJ639_023455 [Escallonia herrerae]
MMQVTLSKKLGVWVVDKFQDVHNHPLTTTPSKVIKHRSHRSSGPVKVALIETINEYINRGDHFTRPRVVVAPMHLSWPLASIGLKVRNIHGSLNSASAKNKVDFVTGSTSTSLKTAFNLSSNSPRYFAPATRAPISKAMTITSIRLNMLGLSSNSW